MSVHCKYFVNFSPLCYATILFFGTILPVHSQLPANGRQVIVATTSDWDSFHATLQCWERDHDGEGGWRPAPMGSWSVLLGRNGLAWGRGNFAPSNPDIPWKVERDGKAPAGIFELGSIHGYAESAPSGTSWPYYRIGPWDAWIDDPKLQEYNQHIRVDPHNVPPWFEKQKMRLGDNAYKWLIEIKHNTNPIKPGFGSAIFFHVRRGPDRPTAGCTTMAEDNLTQLMRWLREDKHPYYVLLPKAEYEKVRTAWRLP